jgi:hypothetical protein
MKYIISIVIGVAAFFAVGFSLEEFTRIKNNNIIIFAFIAGFSALGICLYKFKSGKSMVDIVSDSLLKLQSTKDLITSNIDSKNAALFAQAEQEVSDGDIDKGLWSQSLVKAKGDENLRKVEYMKLRVKQIKKNT